MSTLLPIIQQLADAPDDAARADWLLRCPLSILMTYQETIRNRLDNDGFEAGCSYLDAMLSVLRSVRDGDGDFRGDLHDTAHADLTTAARGAAP